MTWRAETVFIATLSKWRYACPTQHAVWDEGTRDKTLCTSREHENDEVGGGSLASQEWIQRASKPDLRMELATDQLGRRLKRVRAGGWLVRCLLDETEGGRQLPNLDSGVVKAMVERAFQRDACRA